MRKQVQMLVAMMLMWLVIPARAQGQTVERQSTQAHDEAGAGGGATQATQAIAEDPNYRIGAQDVLDINVWKQPDISRAVPVRPDGKISLPLLNDVQAAGLTPSQLAAELTTDLTKYMTNPQVTVIVSQINSQRFYILGQVSHAGAYMLLPGMTVLQALSNAGGFTEFANVKHIYVLRKENGKENKLFFNYKEVSGGKRSEQNIALKAGDTIFVP